MSYRVISWALLDYQCSRRGGQMLQYEDRPV